MNTQQEIDRFVSEIHAPARRRFKRRQVISGGLFNIVAVDLIDVSNQANDNRGYKFILTAIELYSRYAWTLPLKTKNGSEVAQVLEQLFNSMRQKPNKLWSDRGSEFFNPQVRQLLQRENIQIYTTRGITKNSIVERFNRTLREELEKVFQKNRNLNWIDNIQKVVRDYNNTEHSSVKAKPKDVYMEKERSAGVDIFPEDLNKSLTKRPKFRKGDRVRLQRKKGTFEKGFRARWTTQVFKISEVQRTIPMTYKVEDLNGHQLPNSYHEPELLKARQELFFIEQVIDTKTINGRSYSLVRWEGYGSDFDQWIPTSEVRDVQRLQQDLQDDE